jgi:hypothetical protein
MGDNVVTAEAMPLSLLYDHDETAWLEEMARLAAEARLSEMDFKNLSDYLADMAKRDRREVFSRLVVLLTHLLKWEYQPDRRSESWVSTIFEQRGELRMLLESGVLRSHALSILADAYEDARKRAAAETGLPRNTFPAKLDRDLDALLADDEEE